MYIIQLIPINNLTPTTSPEVPLFEAVLASDDLCCAVAR